MCNVMELNGMHVEDVKDICMECNTVYSRLNNICMSKMSKMIKILTM